ncbi:hypothetical protein J1614_005321 [Plenodomus biglobosus]|nr:hypothetical protein J1614_005321 [Plenodomus biglobosus]
MVTAEENLEQLRAALDDNGACLKHAPLEQVQTKPLDDPDSLSFAILFGYTREERGDNEREVWVHLYPLAGNNGRAEVQFHSHADPERGHVKYDGPSVIKLLSRRAAAFTLPGTAHSSRSKILALTRYYFLQKLAEYGNEADIQKIALGGLPLSKTMREELEAACWALNEASLKAGTAHSQPFEAPNPFPSSLPQVLDHTNRIEQTTEANQALAARVGQDQELTALSATSRPTIETLIALKTTEEGLARELLDIDNEMATLAAKRKAKSAEADAVKKQREGFFRGLDLMEAYRLGEEVGRAEVEDRVKRQKRE